MRRFAGFLLLLSVALGVGLLSDAAAQPTTRSLNTALVRGQMRVNPGVIFAGQCTQLSWDLQRTTASAGRFFIGESELPPAGGRSVCPTEWEGFSRIQFVFHPDGEASPESYFISVLIIPQDLRLWIAVAIPLGAILLALYLLLPLGWVRRVGSLPVFTRLDALAARWNTRARLLLIALCAGAAVIYVAVMHWAPLEATQVGFGFVALWGGLALVCWLIAESQIEDSVVRFSFSVISSYALTTLFYFAAALLRAETLFYAAQAAFWLAAIFIAIRRKIWRRFSRRAVLQIDWLLVLLILISQIVMVGHKGVYTVDSNGTIAYQVTSDQVYNAGLSYELARHIPPQQATSYAGMPERAYHLFPHLTTMLIARYTGQPDMLTAQVAYGYTAIEILLCLGLYSIMRVLTGSRWAGYLGVVFLYILAIPWPMLYPSNDRFLYFTLFPFGVNGIDLVTITTPQMYASIPLVFGVLLGILLIGLRLRRNLPVLGLVCLTALVAAAMLRFRLQFAVTLIPLTAIWFLYWMINRRNWAFLAGALLLAGAAGLLYLEMRSPAYLQGTSNLVVRYNGLGIDGPTFIQSFPFASDFAAWLSSIPDSSPTLLDATLLQWFRHLGTLSGFALLNVIGIPALLTFALMLILQIRKREYLFFCLFILALMLGSIAASGSLWTAYDTYSVGGQIAFVPNWYVFPLVPLGIWSLVAFVRRDLPLSRTIWMAAAGLALVAILLGRSSVPDSTVLQDYRVSAVVSPDTWAMLQHIRDHTPADSVIFSKDWYQSRFYMFSGTAARISYSENIYGIVERYIDSLNPGGSRAQEIEALLAARSEAEFCRLLWRTPITHLVEYNEHPYALHPSACLRKEWTAPQETMSLWSITPSR